jgi:hypothetical protein
MWEYDAVRVGEGFEFRGFTTQEEPDDEPEAEESEHEVKGESAETWL